jgi:hypothetical protein
MTFLKSRHGMLAVMQGLLILILTDCRSGSLLLATAAVIIIVLQL